MQFIDTDKNMTNFLGRKVQTNVSFKQVRQT